MNLFHVGHEVSAVVVGDFDDSETFVNHGEVSAIAIPVNKAVLPAATVNNVVTTNSDNHVVASSTLHDIVPGKTDQDIVTALAIQQLIRTKSDQHVVAVCSVRQCCGINFC